MKIRKKGFTGTEALRLLLALFILFIISYILFSPKQLFSKAKDSIFSFGSDSMPEKNAPQILSQGRVSAELNNYFDRLVSRIKNPGSGESCRLEIGKITNPKSAVISLYPNKIQIGQTSDRGKTPPEKVETIEGFKPCSVRGDKAAKFHECFSKSIKCTDAYQEDASITLDKSSRIAPFLFKFDSKHLCIIYLDGIDFVPGCSQVEGKIDDECTDKIINAYKECA
ncbi:hypothetical protein J4209_07145 [Candidatus Woesearchaeota archaeon]|nr:hypothetical protein [Candidatus Woesearchaeota archaeon]